MTDSADAFDAAIAFAQQKGDPVYIPPGTFQVDRHIIVDNVTIEGAGSWYSIVFGHQVTLEHPGAGRLGTHGRRLLRQRRVGRRQQQRPPVRLRDRGRRPRANRHRPGERHRRGIQQLDHRRPLHPAHQGWHLAGRPDEQPEDHQLRHRRPDRRRHQLPYRRHELGRVEQLHPQHRRRRPGHVVRKAEDANNIFDHNTVQTPVLANGIAIYGGTDNTVSSNLIADPLREGSGIQVGSRFNSQPFTGHLWITDNTTVRAGTYELNWNIGLGAIWIYALREEHQRRHRGGRGQLPRQHL